MRFNTIVLFQGPARYKVFLPVVLSLLILSSCLQDEDLPLDYFEGPSEYYIEFQSGNFTGEKYSLYSTSTSPDHEFHIVSNVQKILSRPLKNRTQNSLRAQSFINWAWVGDTIAGQFPAVFANDTSVFKSGDLQLLFDNGDEYIISIPKGSTIFVTTFGGPQGAIEGEFTFTSFLDYRINGVSNRETASVFIQFKVKRGPQL